jgi:RNA polymerase primary sigma factor
MDIPVERVDLLLEAAAPTASLDAPLGTDGESSLRDFIASSDGPSPQDEAIASSLGREARRALATLTPREAEVLRMRFGIDERSDHTLHEVGSRFRLTRERIRQIEANALRKLRKPATASRLRCFLEK